MMRHVIAADAIKSMNLATVRSIIVPGEIPLMILVAGLSDMSK